jgi:hypothetical protein
MRFSISISPWLPRRTGFQATKAPNSLLTTAINTYIMNPSGASLLDRHPLTSRTTLDRRPESARKDR